MSSPAQRHRERILATQTASVAHAEHGAEAKGTPYELMLAKLAEDKRKLKTIKSIAKKIELKRQLLPEYSGWVVGVLSADNPVRDDVVATCMVWSIDTGEIGAALEIAGYMLKHDLPLPEKYQRDVPTLVVEQIAELYLTDAKAVTSEQLLHLGQLTEGRDMPDEVSAKLHKATGLSLRETNPTQALDHLQQALRLNARSGVKAEITKLEKQLATPPTPPAT